MKVSEFIDLPYGWRRFKLNVGGFTIRGCRWHAPTRRIIFPVRYSRARVAYEVVRVHGRHVMPLQDLLESGQTETPRDRRPCTLRIGFWGRSRDDRNWIVFDFTVRGFTILWCRWHEPSGSIQLPVTFFFDETTGSYVKKIVVAAYGAHILRLRAALEGQREVDLRELGLVGEPEEPVSA